MIFASINIIATGVCLYFFQAKGSDAFFYFLLAAIALVSIIAGLVFLTLTIRVKRKQIIGFVDWFLKEDVDL